MIPGFITWVTTNRDFLYIIGKAIIVITAFFTVLLPFMQYLSSKGREQRQQNFVNFHDKIMKTISGHEREARHDEQLAVIFELRNYPEYFPVSKRILSGHKAELEAAAKNETSKSLISEINETLEYMNQNRLKRFLTRVKGK